MLKTIKKMYVSLGRYRLLYVLSALEMILIFSYFMYANLRLGSDRFSYYAAYDVIMSGKVDELRTPLYPLIIGILKSIFGFPISRVLIFILHGTVFLFSINWVGKTLGNIVPNNRIGYLFTAVYALYPGIHTYSCYILTESLTISLIAAEIYLVSEAYYHNSYKKAVLSGLVCMALWTLRPGCIYITIIMLVFWGVLFVSRRDGSSKTTVCGLCATLVSLAAIGAYAMMFYKEYHKVGLTCVSTWNNYWMIRESGVIDTDIVENSDIKETIDSVIKTNDYGYSDKLEYWAEIKMLHKELGLYEFDKFVNQQIREHPKEIIAFLFNERLDTMLQYDCVTSGGSYGLPFLLRYPAKLTRVNTGTAFMIFFIALFVLTYVDIKKREISYFIWLLCFFFAASYFTIWLGAMAEYDRLAAPNYPVLLSISCWLINELMCFVAYEKQK